MFSRKSQAPELKQRILQTTHQAYVSLDKITRPRILKQYECQEQCYQAPNSEFEESEKCAQSCDPGLTSLRGNVHAVAKEIQEGLNACLKTCGKEAACAGKCIDSYQQAWDTLIAELEHTN